MIAAAHARGRERNAFRARLAIGGLASALWLMTLPRAHAAEPAPDAVTVYYESCGRDPLEALEVIASLRVELAPLTVRAQELTQDAPRPDLTSRGVWLRFCPGEPARFALIARGTRSEEQRVDLSDSPAAAQSRTLALALAEYYRAHASTEIADAKPAPAAAPLPAAPPPATPPPVPPRAPPHGNESPSVRERELERAFTWYGAAVARAFSREFTWLVGPEFGIALGRARFGIALLGERRSAPLGAIVLATATAHAAYEPVQIGRSPALGLRMRGELGAVFGSGQAQSNAYDAQAFAVQACALTELPLRVSLGQSLTGELAISAGFGRGLVARSGINTAAATQGLLFGLTLALLEQR